MAAKQGFLSTGLVFRKLDLHLHTPASKCFDDRKITPDLIVKEALAKGLDGIAVTDHNSGAWIDAVKKAATETQLVIFPGVEITCMGGKEGIHMIALFDPMAGSKDVESLLGNLELKPQQYGDIHTLVQMSPIAVAEIIARRGGLAILAHANSSKGALEEMRGQQRTDLILCPFVRGAEGTDFQDGEARRKRRRVVDLLDGTDPTYTRKLAVYQASDNPSGRGDGQHAIQGIGTRCAFFKMDRLNIESLGQCLADPDVRIRQDFEYGIAAYPYIKTMRVTGGFLDGAQAEFHQGLNSILGAKGAGKSLLIEFLRFALDQPPTNPEIREDHEGKLSTRLENYGSVEVTVVDETGRDLTVTRVWDEADNHPYMGDVQPPQGFFPALFLSQNEIIKIAESETEQIAFIDQFFDFRSYQQQISELDGRLESLDASLADGLRAHQQELQIEEAIVSVTRDIESLDIALKNPIFDEYSKLEIKDRTLREQQVSLDNLIGQLESTRKEYVRTQIPATPEACAADPAVRRVAEAVSQAKAALVERLVDADGRLAGFKQQIEVEYEKWSPQFKTAKRNYNDAVQKAGGDYRNLAQKRAKRVKELETLQQRLTVTKQKSGQIKEARIRRDAAIDALKGSYENYRKERQARCQKIEDESAGRLRVRIQESSNIDEFKNRLTSLKKGSYLRDAEIDSICAKTDPGTFVKAVIRHQVFRKTNDLEELAGQVGIERDRMVTLADFLGNEFPLEQLLALEHKALPQDRPEILYNVGENKFEALNRLSVGQKCTAMLIIALSDGGFPIVIDQPEDSLDIRTIWEDMCTKIRRGKDRRQFIFTTHNSSLAVASDTDKFTILEAGASNGRVMYSGSMDHSPLNEEVITYLEGGVDTYRTKFGKYRIDRVNQ